MKQRKTMRVWQMIIMLVLALTLFITMFLPALGINGKTVGKIMRAAYENADVKDKEKIGEEELEELIKQAEENADKEVQEMEEEDHISISRITAWNIMSTDFLTFNYGPSPTERQIKRAQKDETFLSVQKWYNIARVLLWIAYAFILVLILLSLLGFFLKWTKFISLIMYAVYGAAATALFGYLRFGLMGSIAGKLESAFQKSEYGKAFSSLSLSEVLSYFYSFAFLMAFIAAITLVVASILFMFTGNRAANSSVEFSGESYGFSSDFDHGFDFGTDSAFGGADNPFNHTDGMGGGIFPGTDTQAKTEAAYNIPEPKPLEPKPAHKPKQPAMGQVRCIKGIASGQGFMLPEDRKVIVGKSPMKANLVINNPHISNVHCSIQYRAFSNTYIIKDHSTNGTYVNGVRLQNNVAMEFPAGTTVSFGDGSDEIILGN